MGEEGGSGGGGAEVMAERGPVGAVPVGGGPGKSDAVPSGCGPQWRGGPAGTGPGGERSLVVANISRFFSSSPDPHFICFQSYVGFSRSCVGVLGVFI